MCETVLLIVCMSIWQPRLQGAGPVQAVAYYGLQQQHANSFMGQQAKLEIWDWGAVAVATAAATAWPRYCCC